MLEGEGGEYRKGSMVEKVLTGGVGKRPRGQPRKRWRDRSLLS